MTRFCFIFNRRHALALHGVLCALLAAPALAASVSATIPAQGITANSLTVRASVHPTHHCTLQAEFASRLSEAQATVLAGQRVKKGEALFSLLAEQQSAALSDARARLEQARQQQAQAQSELEYEQQAARIVNGPTPNTSLKRLALVSARSQAQAATTQVAALQSQLRQAVVRAPFDGVVRKVFVVPGQSIGKGQLLADLASIDDYRVKIALRRPAMETLGLVQQTQKAASTLRAHLQMSLAAGVQTWPLSFQQLYADHDGGELFFLVFSLQAGADLSLLTGAPVYLTLQLPAGGQR